MRLRRQRPYATFMWWMVAIVVMALALDIVVVTTVNTYRNVTDAVCFAKGGFYQRGE